MTFDYDLFVIGGGSGGVRAARIAATGSMTRRSETSSRMSAGERQASTRGGGPAGA